MVWGCIGGTTYELTANAQIWPRSQNSQLGGDEGKIYLIVADMGSPSGQGLDFISGFSLDCVISAFKLIFGLAFPRRLRVPAALLQRVRHWKQPGRPRDDLLH